MKQLFEKQVVSPRSVRKGADGRGNREGAGRPGERRNCCSRKRAIPTQKARIAQREARVAQQQAQLRQRESALAESKLYHRYTSVLSRRTVRHKKSGRGGPGRFPPASRSRHRGPSTTCGWWRTSKETDIERIRPGQEVEIRVDTYKGKKFKGTVDSIMAGPAPPSPLSAGERLGNYVKVVQRVPVKIVLSRGEDPGHASGSHVVVPTILVGERR